MSENSRRVNNFFKNANRADLQNQINRLELAQAMSGVVKYPATMAYNAGTSPFCNCGGFAA